jgi:hypothetical protein
MSHQCVTCGTALSAFNRDMSSGNRCAACARGTSPAAVAQNEAAAFERLPGITEQSIASRSLGAALPRLALGGLGIYVLGAIAWWLGTEGGAKLWLIFLGGGVALRFAIAHDAHPLDVRRWRVFQLGFMVPIAFAAFAVFVLTMDDASHDFAKGAPMMLASLPLAPLIGLGLTYLKDAGNKAEVIQNYQSWLTTKQRAGAPGAYWQPPPSNPPGGGPPNQGWGPPG